MVRFVYRSQANRVYAILSENIFLKILGFKYLFSFICGKEENW